MAIESIVDVLYLEVSLQKQVMFLDFKCVFNEEVQLQILNMLTLSQKLLF